MTKVREDSFTDFDYSAFRRVVDRLLNPVAIVAPDSTLLYANGVAASLVDMDVSHVVGQKMLSFIHPDDRTRVSDELEKIIGGEPRAGFTQFRLRGTQGKYWRTFDSYAHNLIDLATSEVVQHELLVRMVSPEGDIVAPDLFLPTAEEYDLIIEIDRWVISEAARLAAQGHRVEFYLSAKSVADPNI